MHSSMHREDDRAVSEVIAFVLVFATILASIALLYTVGFSALMDYQETEQLHNAERGMEALGQQFNDIHRYDGVEQRESELALRDGVIRTENGSTTVSVDAGGELFDDDDLDAIDNDEVSLGTFEYETDSASDTIAYQGGGTFRSATNGDAVLTPPPIRYADGVLTISLVAIESESQSVSSTDVSSFTATQTDSIRRVGTHDGEVDITVTPDEQYENGWNQTLEAAGAQDIESTGGEIEATFENVERYSINVVGIEIESN